MIHPTPAFVFKAIQRALNFLLVCVGIYFIYMGDVLHRFQAKKTNLAEYLEPMSELPTISTWIVFSGESDGLKLGIDFNISFGAEWLLDNPLRLGKNSLQDILEIELEEDFREEDEPQMYKISPLNFLSGMSEAFLLTYTFRGDENPPVTRVGVGLSTANNSYCGRPHASLYDGEVFENLAKKGEQKWIRIQPIKYLYRESHEKCRDKPYYDMLLEKTLERTRINCPIQCRPEDYTICDTKYKNITKCRNEEEEMCFYKIETGIENNKDIILRPCVKIEYETHVSDQPPTHNNQSVQFWMTFSRPPKVRVKEEYLLFDMVSMISAIGGTMGLCIGFSFGDVTRWLVGQIECGFNRVRSRILRPSQENQHDVEMGVG